MLNVKIEDGYGSGNKASVNGGGSLSVVVYDHPPLANNANVVVPFRSVMSQDGLGVTTDMRVVGTLATPVEFSVLADPEEDIYIKSVAFTIVDAVSTLSKFGNLTALINGCCLFWFTQDQGIVIIDDELKSNFDFVRLCAGQPAFGDSAGSFRASKVVGASEGYIPNLNISNVFGMNWGLRLRGGTNDKFTLAVQDDTTGVDAFNVICYGTKVKIN